MIGRSDENLSGHFVKFSFPQKISTEILARHFYLVHLCAVNKINGLRTMKVVPETDGEILSVTAQKNRLNG